MGILIGADFVPSESNKEYFIGGKVDYLFGKELCSLFKEADYRIFNLEKPLTDKKEPIDKYGPSLIAPTSTITAYKSIGVDLVTLANNHIMDQGTYGLESTMSTLKKENIEYLGVGRSIEEASKPYIIELYQKKIGIYACAEHEFSIVTTKLPGANPYDSIDSCDHIRELKQKCDYIIVLYHGGKEYYRYPSPQLQKRCRRMIESGADLVICQHSHCIGCEEDFNTGKIVYGQGNFLFDALDDEYWRTGLLIEITDQFEIRYIPVVKNDHGVRMANKEDSEKILREFAGRSREILSDTFVEEQYVKFAEAYLEKYLYLLNGKESILFRLINKITRNRFRKYKLKRVYGKKQLLAIRNIIECEAHHELLLQALKKMH